MILQLKAKHFKGTSFASVCNCAIAKAMKEQLSLYFKGGVHVTEFITGLKICVEGGIEQRYSHDIYDTSHFFADVHKAFAAGYDETIIRKIDIPDFNPVITQPVDTLINNVLKTKADDTKDKSPTLQGCTLF
jgi:hypothetical protein